MTQPLPDFGALQPLLDALCEETITAAQLRRLEDLVLGHPEAEAYYVRYMAFCADLVLFHRGSARVCQGRADDAEPIPGRSRGQPKRLRSN